MIIGLAGTIGSGKGAVVEYLKSRGFVQYSSSGLLGELVEAEGNERTREFMARKATELQTDHPGGVVEKNYLEKYQVEKPEHAIFEAIHRQSEANFLKGVGGIIVGVDADLKTRFERTKARNEGPKDQFGFEHFQEQSRIEDEGGGDPSRDNNIREVVNSADHVIVNDGTLKELHAQIDDVLHKIGHES